jgi:hypothetical protein
MHKVAVEKRKKRKTYLGVEMPIGICGQKKAGELTQMTQEGARGAVRGGRM